MLRAYLLQLALLWKLEKFTQCMLHPMRTVRIMKMKETYQWIVSIIEVIDNHQWWDRRNLSLLTYTLAKTIGKNLRSYTQTGHHKKLWRMLVANGSKWKRIKSKFTMKWQLVINKDMIWNSWKWKMSQNSWAPLITLKLGRILLNLWIL